MSHNKNVSRIRFHDNDRSKEVFNCFGVQYTIIAIEESEPF